MKKFGIISGFLGAGKTTLMIELFRYFSGRGIRCELIANDLGECEMVDARYSEKQGAAVNAMPGGCICSRTTELKDILGEKFAAGAEIILSDVPGCGVGALDTVYRDMKTEDTELAPFITVISPEQLGLLSDEDVSYRLHLPKEMDGILRAEIEEADAVVINKTDTMTEEEILSSEKLIKDISSDIRVFTVSAKNSSGIDELAEYILTEKASLTQPEGLGERPEAVLPQFKLSWYDSRYYVKVCCDDFSPDEYLSDLMENARFSFASMNANIPHLKIFAAGQEGDYAKYSLTGIDYPVGKDQPYGKRATELTVIINARFLCPAALAGQIMKAVIDTAGKKHNLDTMIYLTTCK